MTKCSMNTNEICDRTTRTGRRYCAICNKNPNATTIDELMRKANISLDDTIISFEIRSKSERQEKMTGNFKSRYGKGDE